MNEVKGKEESLALHLGGLGALTHPFVTPYQHS